MNLSQALHASSHQRSLSLLLLMGVSWVFVSPVHAQYPKVNLAVGYEVDPDWPQKPERFHWRYVTSVAVDAKDRVWVLNEHEPQVQVYGEDGEYIDSWGPGFFGRPHHIHIDRDQNVWVTDFGLHIVQKFTPKGELLQVLGKRGQTALKGPVLNRPSAVVTTPKGDAFVSDGYGNNRVVHYDREGKFVKEWGRLGQGVGEFSQPHTIALDSKGRLYVAERNNCRVQIFDQEGRSLAQWRNLMNPWGIWITPKDEVYICGSSPARWTELGNLGNPPHDALMIKFDTTGRALELWHFPLVRDEKLEPGRIDWIHGIAVDSKGNVYLSDVADDTPSHRVQKFIRLPAEK